MPHFNLYILYSGLRKSQPTLPHIVDTSLYVADSLLLVNIL